MNRENEVKNENSSLSDHSTLSCNTEFQRALEEGFLEAASVEKLESSISRNDVSKGLCSVLLQRPM